MLVNIMAAVAENIPPVSNDKVAVDDSVATEQKEQTEQTTKTEQSNGDAVTVFHDPEHFNVKHPLMHKWTLWFTKPPSGKVRIFSLLPRLSGFAES